MKSYVDDLFRYIETFETNVNAFETEAFVQTYQGILAVFQESRKQRDKAIELDELFLERIKRTPLNTSDLRQITVQVMISLFETVADIDGQSNKAYSYVRGLREVRQDVPYLENHILPLLYRDGSLKGNFRLTKFFLNEIARYLNKYGSPIKQNIAPEEFLGMGEPKRMLELARRRLEMGTGLMEDRSTLEHHLANIDEFKKMAGRSKLAANFLSDWEYLRSESFWDKVKAVLDEAAGKFKGIFSSWSYARLVMSQRNPAYIVYSILIILFIWFAIYVPSYWSDYKQDKLDDFRERSTQQVNR